METATVEEPRRAEENTFIVTNVTGWDARARLELRRLLPGASVESLFIRGNIVVVSPEAVDVVLDRLRGASTRYISRITPVQWRLGIGPGSDQLGRIAETASLLRTPDRSRSFRVTCTRRGTHDFTSRDVEMRVADVFVDSTGPRVDLESPEQILCIEIYQQVAWLGMNEASDVVTKPLRCGRKWAPGNRPVSRAEHKLRELLRKYDITLPAEARALDLGAAPGGWSRVLAARVAEVVAVDPGALDERVLELPNVTHLRCRTDDLDPAELGLFQIVTNDMNMRAAESAQLMCDVAPLVEPGALAVMTVKFFTPHPGAHVDAAVKVLQSEYEGMQVRRMPHNAKETSLIMRRKGGD